MNRNLHSGISGVNSGLAGSLRSFRTFAESIVLLLTPDAGSLPHIPHGLGQRSDELPANCD